MSSGLSAHDREDPESVQGKFLPTPLRCSRLATRDWVWAPAIGVACAGRAGGHSCAFDGWLRVHVGYRFLQVYC